MRSKAFFAAAMLMSSIACSSPFSPSSGGADTFVWTVDGQSFRATDNGMGALRASGTVSLTGIDCSGGAGLSLFVVGDAAVGSYPSGSGFFATYTPDGRTSASGGINWEAGPRGGSGSLTVSSVSATRVSGNFALQMVPGSGNPSGGTRSVQGSFDLSFHNKTIC